MVKAKNTTYTYQCSKRVPGVRRRVRGYSTKVSMWPVRVFLARSTHMCVVAMIFMAMLTLPSVAHPSGMIPPYAVMVAGRHVGNMSWGIWLFGKRHKQNCWGTRTQNRREITSESVTCGVAVSTVPYQLAASGAVGTRRVPQSLLFFLVQPRVRRLDVLVKSRGPKSPQWVSSKSHSINTKRRQKAHLSGNFSYAVKVIRRRRICVVRIRAFNASGDLIGRGRLNVCV